MAEEDNPVEWMVLQEIDLAEIHIIAHFLMDVKKGQRPELRALGMVKLVRVRRVVQELGIRMILMCPFVSWRLAIMILLLFEKLNVTKPNVR